MADRDFWNQRGQDNARGRRFYARRASRNLRAFERVERETEAMESRLDRPPPSAPPRGYGPRNRGSRPQTAETRVSKIDISITPVELYPVVNYYELPIQTRCFAEMCFKLYELFSHGFRADEYMTASEFALCMSYLLHWKLAKVSAACGNAVEWISTFDACVNLSQLKVPVMIARYLDAVGVVKMKSGVKVRPVVLANYRYDGWPVITDYSDSVELKGTLVPMSLAGCDPPDDDLLRVLPIYDVFDRVRLVHSAVLPRWLAYESSLMSKWMTLAARLEKRISMSEVSQSIEGNDSLLIVRQELDGTDFVVAESCQDVEAVPAMMGALFGFHERRLGLMKEARCIVWGQYVASARYPVLSTMTDLSVKTKPP